MPLDSMRIGCFTAVMDMNGNEGDAMAEVLATPANMRKHASAGLFAYSPSTGEQYSATADDYWHLADNDCLLDSDGEPMVLATESTTVTPVTSC